MCIFVVFNHVSLQVMDESFENMVYASTYFGRIANLRQNGSFTDVMLKADGLELKCHKIVLSAASAFFDRMFHTNMEEAQTGVVTLEGVDSAMLQAMVDYIYTTRVEITTENMTALYTVGDQYDICGLKDLARSFIMENVTEATCLQLYEFSYIHNELRLRRECLKQEFSLVVQSNKFLESSAEGLAQYIGENHLWVPSEDAILAGVIIWINHKPEERRHTFRMLLEKVRLQYCSTVYLTQVLNENEFIATNYELTKLITGSILGRSRGVNGTVPPRTSTDMIPVLTCVGGCGTDNEDNRVMPWLLVTGCTWSVASRDAAITIQNSILGR